MEKDFQNLRFNITEDMNNTFIELLLTKQMLENKKTKKKDRQLLEEHLNNLKNQFVLDFRKNNVEERKIYNELMNK
ncbi:MAG: hypothetical protein HFH09_02900 [Bacilli bacterium]|nr:hypothetical protein [Bacilli bacterium]